MEPLTANQQIKMRLRILQFLLEERRRTRILMMERYWQVSRDADRKQYQIDSNY